MYGPDKNTEHYRRIERELFHITEAYVKALRRVIKAAQGIQVDPNKPFKFSDHPRLDKEVRAALNDMASDIRARVINSIEKEWNQANVVNDAMVERVFKFKKLGTVPEVYMDRNFKAMDAFIARKTGAEGLNLSQRVWKYTSQFKQELEMALDLGLADGKSAQTLSREIRSYLNEPEKLFRRVRDKHGVLQLSKNAKVYHPGQGVYRSSFKNAHRLARTEINMAYRTADHVRWQKLPFVVGIEIKLSDRPREKDICDHLIGKYPKDFKFVGWHPNCRCYEIAVLLTNDEFDKTQQQLLDGQTRDFSSRRTVINVPDGFKKWMKDHKESYARARERDTLPYFVRDNQKYVEI